MNSNEPKQALNVFSKAMAKSLPGVIQDASENFKEARIKAVQSENYTASVSVVRSNQIISNVKYPRYVSSIKSGDTCIIFSPDPKNRSRTYIIAVF